MSEMGMYAYCSVTTDALENTQATFEYAILYQRAADGSLSLRGSLATGGAGTGADLGSENAVIVSEDR